MTRPTFILSLSRLIPICAALFLIVLQGRGGSPPSTQPLSLPAHGHHELRILSPLVLELTLITSDPPGPESAPLWNLVDSNARFVPPPVLDFNVTVDGLPAPVESIGFKRRVLYAPLRHRDLRIASHLYLELAAPLDQNLSQEITVTNPSESLWPPHFRFSAVNDPLRLNPAIHVNQVGYVPDFPKRAMIGYFLGSLGELELPPTRGFQLLDTRTGRPVFRGALHPRRDVGYDYLPTPYQEVLEADFTAFRTPGEYRLQVPGLGVSLPFLIDDGAVMAFARAYALGLYHQRCGTGNTMPFTRHIHGPCHTNLASIPLPAADFEFTWDLIGQVSQEDSEAPGVPRFPLSQPSTQLYPIVTRGTVDVSGGHHDAGDYSKYTLNSASLIHALLFSVDAFPDVAQLDNLGLPESGDGISDLLQEALWEADFLARMQDDDGGFYYLVYPRNRRYESNVLPDAGDPQVVWPKNTASTAAAVAALAECASSPALRYHYPDRADLYLQAARRGWQFLVNAVTRHGHEGAYQSLLHFGDNFGHDDELAWAACAMFVATGDPIHQEHLFAWMPHPDSETTRRWGWWRLSESWGNAIRTYAFAARTGRLRTDHLDPDYLGQCEQELLSGGKDAMRWSRQSAYGTSFPDETKRVRSGGWYFSSDQAFDITVAYQLDPRLDFGNAILENLNYEAGCNPVNVCHVSGLGWKRQREIVHQYSQNDPRVLPPSGFPAGNIQSGFQHLDLYKSELGRLSFPPDDSEFAPYPFYDRWSDAYNVTTEFSSINIARSLASLAFIATLSTTGNSEPWTPVPARIVGPAGEVPLGEPVTLSFQSPPGLDPGQAQVVWEARDQQPAFGPDFTITPVTHGLQWVEAEAVWPDGRRVFATHSFQATNGFPSVHVAAVNPVFSEPGDETGILRFERTGDASSLLTLHFEFGGTATKFDDYRRPEGDLPASIVIPAGATTADLSLVAYDDSEFEGPESVVLSLLPGEGYNVGMTNSAALTLEDDDLSVKAIQRSRDGSIHITWFSVPGRTYRVETAGGFTHPDWTSVSPEILAEGNSASWSGNHEAGTFSRFYRVVELREPAGTADP